MGERIRSLPSAYSARIVRVADPRDPSPCPQGGHRPFRVPCSGRVVTLLDKNLFAELACRIFPRMTSHQSLPFFSIIGTASFLRRREADAGLTWTPELRSLGFCFRAGDVRQETLAIEWNGSIRRVHDYTT